MIARARRSLLAAACIPFAGCGHFGLELVDLPASNEDGAPPDAGLDAAAEPDADAASVAVEASTDEPDSTAPHLDAASADAADARDADASPASDDAGHDASGDASDDASGDLVAADASALDATRDAMHETVDAAVDAASACTLDGSWAVKVSIALEWPAGAVVAGSGNAALWARFEVTGSGTTMTGTLLPCGFTLPDYDLASTPEKYSFRLPPTLFDHTPSYLSTAPVTFAISSDGRTITLGAASILFGTTLANPQTDPWPLLGALTDHDQDGDGQPGVRGAFHGDATYMFPRLDSIVSARADQGDLAARIAFQATGNVVGCTSLSGPATFQHFDTHIVGCRVASGTTCTPAQRDVLDANRPMHTVRSASYAATKVAPSATCATIRAAMP
jgi:hypothetical protein